MSFLSPPIIPLSHWLLLDRIQPAPLYLEQLVLELGVKITLGRCIEVDLRSVPTVPTPVIVCVSFLCCFCHDNVAQVHHGGDGRSCQCGPAWKWNVRHHVGDWSSQSN